MMFYDKVSSYWDKMLMILVVFTRENLVHNISALCHRENDLENWNLNGSAFTANYLLNKLETFKAKPITCQKWQMYSSNGSVHKKQSIKCPRRILWTSS